MGSLTVRCGGTWLETLGDVGEVSFTTRQLAAPWEASWSMSLPLRFEHPALRRGAVVEVMAGPVRVWFGLCSEPVPGSDGWRFEASGMSRERFLCLTSGGVSTSTPDTAIDRAIADGAHWTRPVSLSSTAYKDGDTTDGLNWVTDLLDGWSDEAGVRWGVNALGEIRAAADPTVPDWHMTPASGSLGLADDEFATDLYGRYKNTSGGYSTVHVSDAAAAAKYGRVEEPVDLTGLGAITSGRATTVLNGMLAKGKARMGWADGLAPGRFDLLSPGGVPADFRFVKAGQMVRLHGIVDRSRATASLTTDFVIGETRYEHDTGELQLLPVDMAARTLSDVLSIDSKIWKA